MVIHSLGNSFLAWQRNSRQKSQLLLRTAPESLQLHRYIPALCIKIIHPNLRLYRRKKLHLLPELVIKRVMGCHHLPSVTERFPLMCPNIPHVARNLPQKTSFVFSTILVFCAEHYDFSHQHAMLIENRELVRAATIQVDQTNESNRQRRYPNPEQFAKKFDLTEISVVFNCENPLFFTRGRVSRSNRELDPKAATKLTAKGQVGREIARKCREYCRKWFLTVWQATKILETSRNY